MIYQGKEYLYMAVSNDEYELPLAVAGSCAELSRMIKVKKSSIQSAISKGCKTYVKVEVIEDD